MLPKGWLMLIFRDLGIENNFDGKFCARQAARKHYLQQANV